MQFPLHVTCSCIPMHTYFLFNTFSNIFCYLELFWLSLSPSLSLLFALVCFYGTKRKSIPSRNPLCFGASTSFDSTPFSVRFHDEKAKLDFLKNFSQRGIHSECQVILSDFSDTDLPTVIHSKEWESLCDILVTCPFVLIQEFYSNMHGIDCSVP